MVKYVYRLLLFIFLLVGGSKAYAAIAPANTTIGTQATLTYVDPSNATQTVMSNIVVITVNPVQVATISPGISSSGTPGEAVTFPVKITNSGNVADKYSLYTANDDNLENLLFTIDSNGNGIIDSGESTTISPNGLTPIIQPGDSISLVVSGNIPSGAVSGSTQIYAIHAKIDGTTTVVWNNNSFLITSLADISVVKSIGTTSTPGAFVYVFEIKNPSNTPGANLVLTDNLPAGIVPDDTVGRWFPFGQTAGKNIPLTDTGYETISDDVALSVINNELVFKVKNIPADAGGTGTNGGILHLRVKPAPGTSGGTTVTNTASYIYNNGAGFTSPKNTNSVSQVIPKIANVTVEKLQQASSDPDVFVYLFKFKNDSDVAASNFEMIDNLPSNIVPDLTTGLWFPINQLSVKTITLANDGYETVSDEVDLSLVNGVLKFKIKDIAANSGNNGGVLQVRFKAAPGTPAGTVINNSASYTYNNGQFMTSPVNSNTATYIVPGGNFDVEITADLSRTLARGEEFVIPQTVTNIGTSADSYNLSLTGADQVENAIFYYDDNGDGIRQLNENTPVTQTGSIGGNSTFKFFLVGRWGANAPSTDSFRIYATSRSNSNINDWSTIDVSSYNSGVAVILTSNLTLPAAAGQSVLIPQTLENRTGAPDTFDLSVEEAYGIFSSVKFIVDDNGDGVRQSSENTEITTTPAIANNTTYKFFTLVTLNNNVTLGNQFFRIFARANTFVAGSDWSDITLQVSVNTANISVIKSIGTTGVPGAFVYVFDIENTGTANATDLVITDTLPNNVEPDITTGVWFPFGQTTGKSVTNADDGYEAISDDVDFSFVNGVLTLKVKTITPGAGIPGTNGGTLHFRVRPVAGTTGGTVIENTASFIYNNSSAVTSPENTNTATYTTTTTFGVDLTADLSINLARREDFSIPQTVTNTGSTNDSFTLSLADDTYVENPSFILDDNNDGIRQLNENTVITSTTSIAPNATFKFFLKGRWSDNAPSGNSFKIIATSVGDNQFSDLSLITVNSFTAGAAVDLLANLTINSAPGQEIVFVQTLTNLTGAADTFNLSLENTDGIFSSFKFFIDDNNDGIRQANENNQITTTPSIDNNASLKYFVVATLKNDAPLGTKVFRTYARSVTFNAGLDWSIITLEVSANIADINVIKSIGTTGVPGAFVYVF
ncbi:hypothetical protein, partial [uncultured Cetobacterium sp.]|uniref:beta strand repeat-containing protein n=1 Tax=uncultured Cetobacterium sp. TaxID=527638 RepID=UPI002639472F